MFPSALAVHTGHMAQRVTAFITGATGFISAKLVRLLAGHGHQVVGLAESVEAAARVRLTGAVAVMGDLLEAGQWQDEAAADWVFHLPPQPTCGPGSSRRRAASIARSRVAMDSRPLDAVASRSTRRIVYVADTSVYGAVGPRSIASLPGSRTVPCACGGCPRRRFDACRLRSSTTTSALTPCSRTSDCAGSASGSAIPRLNSGIKQILGTIDE